MLKKLLTNRAILVSIILIIICISSNIKIALANEEVKIAENGTTEEVVPDDGITNEIYQLYDYINGMKLESEIMNELSPKEYVEEYIKNGEGNLSVKKVINAIISYLFREVKSVLVLCISIIVIAIICSLIKNLQSAFSSDGISNIAFFACYSILIIILSRSFLISINIAVDLINDLSNFMGALLPVLVLLIGSIGGFAQAATMDPIIMGATILIPRIYSTVIIPLILVAFVLEFTNNISTEYKINNLCKIVKQIILWLQGIILTIFIGILTIRGAATSTIDAVTLKTAKFAIDNFIPLVGKAFSDAITSVAGYSLLIKNAISAIGLVIIIFMMLFPVIKLVLISFIYKVTAAVIEPISDKRITSSIAMAGDSLILLMSCLLSITLMFFILLAIMASAGKFVIGG